MLEDKAEITDTWVRHFLTVNNHSKRMQSWDEQLHPDGLHQGALLVERLRNSGFYTPAIICGPQERHKRSAELIRSGLGNAIDIEESPLLAERQYPKRFWGKEYDDLLVQNHRERMKFFAWDSNWPKEEGITDY